MAQMSEQSGFAEITTLDRLEALRPMINEILEISGTAGASVGVIFDDKEHTMHFGFRNVESKEVPDNETVYYIASLTKFMTAAGIALLVDDDRLEWYELVHGRLPDFQHQSKYHMYLTIVDILSHSSGLAPSLYCWMREHSEPAVRSEDFVKTAMHLEPICPPNTRFISNNWTYGLAARIIEKVTEQEFHQFMHDSFFSPLQMHNTWIHNEPQKPVRVAKPYMYNGASPYPVRRPPIEVGSSYEGAIGVKSCVTDLLKFYRTFLSDAHDLKDHPNPSQTGDKSPFLVKERASFKQTEQLLKPHIHMDEFSWRYPNRKTGYTLGWACTNLPNKLGTLGGNTTLVSGMPTIGDCRDEKVFYHSGALVGYLSSAILVPKRKAAIIVLCNTLANQDPADWISQAVLEVIIDAPYPTDFVSLAKEAAAGWNKQFEDLHKAIDENTVPGPVLDVGRFVGVYENAAGSFVLDVYLHGPEESLCVALNGNRGDVHHLKPYRGSRSFTFEMTYSDCLQMEMWPKTYAKYYVLEFLKGSYDVTDRIHWRPDPSTKRMYEELKRRI